MQLRMNLTLLLEQSCADFFINSQLTTESSLYGLRNTTTPPHRAKMPQSFYLIVILLLKTPFVFHHITNRQQITAGAVMLSRIEHYMFVT